MEIARLHGIPMLLWLCSRRCLKRRKYGRLLVTIGLSSLASGQPFPLSAAEGHGPIFRFPEPLSHLALSPGGDFLAYLTTNESRQAELRMVELKTKAIYGVSKQRVGAGFTWDPLGNRLIYREVQLNPLTKNLDSVLKIYDSSLHKSVTIATMAASSGYPTLNPRDLRLYTLTTTGLRITHLTYPGSRLAKWQSTLRDTSGNWVVTQNGVLWATYGGLDLTRLHDDGSPVGSYTISPDGQAIAWATTKGRLFMSVQGNASRDLGSGRDPHWHPSKKLLVYAAGRMVGRTTAGYDLRLVDAEGQGRWITFTQRGNERWPQWHPAKDLIFYTIAHTTDLYALEISDGTQTPSQYAIKR